MCIVYLVLSNANWEWSGVWGDVIFVWFVMREVSGACIVIAYLFHRMSSEQSPVSLLNFWNVLEKKTSKVLAVDSDSWTQQSPSPNSKWVQSYWYYNHYRYQEKVYLRFSQVWKISWINKNSHDKSPSSYLVHRFRMKASNRIAS